MDINKEREAFEIEFSKIKSDISFWVNTWDEDMQGYNHPVMCWIWHIWQASKAQSDKKIKLLLCDEHLQKCESPTGIFNSQYPDEEPCLICLTKDSKAQAVPAQLDVNSILHDIDCYFDNGLSNTERTANNLLQLIYEKLSGEVKAQEPAND